MNGESNGKEHGQRNADEGFLGVYRMLVELLL